MDSQALSYRGKIAGLERAVRNGERAADDPALTEARLKFKELRASDYIRKLVDSAPPLTSEQRTRLAELLRPVRQRDTGTRKRGGPR